MHHENYGRRLTRDAITAALKGNMNEKTVRFESDGSISDVRGRLTEIVIPDSGEVVSIFFTYEHAAYWLANLPLDTQTSPSLA